MSSQIAHGGPRQVLMLLPYANIGGTERHVQLLCRGLCDLGMHVRVLLPEGPAVEAFMQDGITFRVLPPPSVASMPTWAKAVAAAVDEGADLIHVHAAMELVWVSRLARPAIPVVFTAHGYHLELDYMKAGLMLNRTAGAVIAVSQAERSRLLRYGLKPALSRVVPNGVSLDGLAGGTSTLREGLDVPEGGRLIGMVNRLDAFKGVDLMLKAFQRLHARDPRHRLAIVGDGQERPRLEALSRELGLERFVYWLGHRTDLGHTLRAFDLFVSPTRKEAFGMAVVEAMACGLPVVVTDLPALRAIVTPGREGDLIPLEAEPERWADVVGELLADASLLSRYGAAARVRAEDFGLPQMAEATRRVYQALSPD